MPTICTVFSTASHGHSSKRGRPGQVDSSKSLTAHDLAMVAALNNQSNQPIMQTLAAIQQNQQTQQICEGLQGWKITSMGSFWPDADLSKHPNTDSFVSGTDLYFRSVSLFIEISESGDGQSTSKQQTVEWCSWLSRQSNTLKVSGSNPGLISASAPLESFIFLPVCVCVSGGLR
ncbi:hypothetical protein B0T16DRAFT_75215 [Cercophora newfieldiana]|uniref:Uncharacterized protein n=1 Tax=Cercophora newfieldiana TaxID=92897 RepID=A0AA39YEV2_9PEZI|nr:hypothetical protein B0T16DRAFT_75215 [Cercophora newfieldiana]